MNPLQRIIQNLAAKPTNSGPFHITYNGKRHSADLHGLYRNAGCVLVASGPDDTTLDILKQPGIITGGLNNSLKVFRPNLWFTVDTPSRFLESGWLDPSVLKFCGIGPEKPQPVKRWLVEGETEWQYSKRTVVDCPGVIQVDRNENFRPGKFFAERSVNWGNSKWGGGGRTVTMFAIKILYLLGFRRIYLSGVSFQMTEKKRYRFAEQRRLGAINNNTKTYLRFLSYFAALSHQFERAGLEVYQCTPDSELCMFPFMPLDNAVERELRDFPNTETEETWGMYLNNEGSKVSAEDRAEYIERRSNAT